MADMIAQPPHYVQFGETYEPINVIEAWRLGYRLGNVLKYIARREMKGDALENLRKARWYLDREIATLETS